MGEGAARERLNTAMDARRVDRRMRWVEVAERAQMSVQNLSLIRKGKINITDLAAANLEDALEWAPGSIAAVLAGGDATLKARQRVDAPGDEIGAILAYIDQRWGPDATQEVLDATRRARGGDSGESQADYQAK